MRIQIGEWRREGGLHGGHCPWLEGIQIMPSRAWASRSHLQTLWATDDNCFCCFRAYISSTDRHQIVSQLNVGEIPLGPGLNGPRCDFHASHAALARRAGFPPTPSCYQGWDFCCFCFSSSSFNLSLSSHLLPQHLV